jgi:hypothetical protein
MQNAPVNIDMAEMGKAVRAFVRSRAILAGSSIIYQQNDVIIKEDPRTGQKTVISPQVKK